jgi:hypothetical protein
MRLATTDPSFAIPHVLARRGRRLTGHRRAVIAHVLRTIRSLAAPLLSGLLLLSVLGMDLPVIHDHRGNGEGLYNEECALATLALAHAGFTAPAPPDGAPPQPTGSAPPPAAPLHPPSPSVLRAAARAPPA